MGKPREGTTETMNGGESVVESTFTVMSSENEVSPLTPSRRHPSWNIRRALVVMTTIGGLVLVLMTLGSLSSDLGEEESSASRIDGVVTAAVKEESIQTSSTESTFTTKDSMKHSTLIDSNVEEAQHARELQFIDREPQSVVNTITNQLNLRAFEASGNCCALH